MPPLLMPHPNMQQLQPPSHLNLLPHPHLPRPPQMPPHGMPSPSPSSMGSSPAPSSMPTSLPLPIAGPMGLQGTMNQMLPPMPQNHFLSMNPMQSGSLPTSGAPSAGGFPSGPPNMQGHSNPMGGQMYQHGGQFNRSQGGQMQMLPGFNQYQSGNQAGMPLLPPGPPPHSQTPQ